MMKQIGISLLILTTVAMVAPRKAEADCTGAVVIGGLMGLFVGSALQAHANCQHNSVGGYQRHLMQEVLQNYDARRHCEFVEYVTIDLEGWLSAHQQEQLLNLLQQRRMCFLQDNCCVVR